MSNQKSDTTNDTPYRISTRSRSRLDQKEENVREERNPEKYVEDERLPSYLITPLI